MSVEKVERVALAIYMARFAIEKPRDIVQWDALPAKYGPHIADNSLPVHTGATVSAYRNATIALAKIDAALPTPTKGGES